MKYKTTIYDIKSNGSVDGKTYDSAFVGDKLRIYKGTSKWIFWDVLDLDMGSLKIEKVDCNNIFHIVKKRIPGQNEPVYQQIKQVIHASEEDLEDFGEVDSDVLYGTITDFNDTVKNLTTISLWKKVAPYVGMGLIAVTIIILYVLLLNRGGV